MTPRRLIVLLALGLIVVAVNLHVERCNRNLPRDTTIAHHVLPDLAGALNRRKPAEHRVKADDKTAVTLTADCARTGRLQARGYAADLPQGAQTSHRPVAASRPSGREDLEPEALMPSSVSKM